MPAYLKFYDLEHSPFEDDSQSKVVLGTKALRDALTKIRSGLDEGATRICVNGQAGLGKTSLARALPKLLEEPTRVAVILDPARSWDTIRTSVANQWKVGDGGLARSNLVSFSDDTRLVLVLDQAETASTDILDHLDVMLSYRSEHDEPIVQSVLFANLSTHVGAEPSPLIWWLDRIQTLELQFAPLPRNGVASYIEKHLQRAGWRDGSLFDADAAQAIHGYTGGIPREVDRVCERLLSEAAKQNIRSIGALFIHEILDDIVEVQEVQTNEVGVVPGEGRPDPFENKFEALVHEEEFIGAEHVGAHSYEPDASDPGSTDESFEDVDRADSTSLPNHPDEGEPTDGSENLVSVSDDSMDDQVEPEAESSDETEAEVDASSVEDEDEADEGEGSLLELVDSVADADAEQGDEEFAEQEERDSRDASLIELEAYLSRPASDEELREIQGRGFARFGAMAAALALVVALGSMALVWLSSGKSDSVAANEISSTDSQTPRSISDPTLFAGPEGLLEAEPAPQILARLRGPLPDSEQASRPERNSTPSNFDQGLPTGNGFFSPPPAASADFDSDSGPE